MSSAPCTQWNAGVMAFLGGAAFVLQLIGAASDDWYNDKETGEHFGIFRECPIGESGCSTRGLNTAEEAAAAIAIISVVSLGFYVTSSIMHACACYSHKQQGARIVLVVIAVASSIGAWAIMTTEYEAHKDDNNLEVRSGAIIFGIGAFLTVILLVSEAIASCHIATRNGDYGATLQPPVYRDTQMTSF